MATGVLVHAVRTETPSSSIFTLDFASYLQFHQRSSVKPAPAPERRWEPPFDMYVCLCNGYRESELRELARRGFSDAKDAYLALGDGPSCGCCVEFAQEILDTERRLGGRDGACSLSDKKVETVTA